MRLIDADALIEKMVQIPLRQWNTKTFGEALDSIPTVGVWISVKDRMPKDETEVVIIVQHKIGWYRAFAWHDEYGWHSSAEEFGDGESDFVTYWMPLPEPPEEVQDD